MAIGLGGGRAGVLAGSPGLLPKAHASVYAVRDLYCAWSWRWRWRQGWVGPRLGRVVLCVAGGRAAAGVEVVVVVCLTCVEEMR